MVNKRVENIVLAVRRAQRFKVYSAATIEGFLDNKRRIAQVLQINPKTIERVKQRFVEE